jgi:hypothetical protein
MSYQVTEIATTPSKVRREMLLCVMGLVSFPSIMRLPARFHQRPVLISFGTHPGNSWLI